MALVEGFPARQPSGQTNIRVFISGTTQGDEFDDTGNSFVFIDVTGANPYTPLPVVLPGDDISKKGNPGVKTAIPNNPAGTGENHLTDDPSLPVGQGHLTQPSIKAYIWAENIRIRNTGVLPLEFSFDGVNVHGSVPASTTFDYMDRREAGIAVRHGVGGATTYVIEAW